MKAEKLQDIWTEKELIEKFGLKAGVTDRSSTIGTWIRKGLPYIDITSRRYFFEGDIVEFLAKFRQKGKRAALKDTDCSSRVLRVS